MFLPQHDTKELSYMKQQFGIINSKLDSIMAGQNELKAAIDILQLTQSIDPQKIHYLRNKAKKLQINLLNDLWTRNSLSTSTKHELKKLIDDFKETQLEAMITSLIWSITGKQYATGVKYLFVISLFFRSIKIPICGGKYLKSLHEEEWWRL